MIDLTFSDIEEVQITQYVVGDRVFDTREQAEKYVKEDKDKEERLKKLLIDVNIDIPRLLYNNLNNNILAKADTGFRFFIAYNKSDLNFLYKYSRTDPFNTGITSRTPCIVAINKFRHLFITTDTLIEKGEELSSIFHQYDDELAEMEKQIASLEINLGVK
jgi:hypothetical protein